jgi:hypothetical protein
MITPTRPSTSRTTVPTPTSAHVPPAATRRLRADGDRRCALAGEAATFTEKGFIPTGKDAHGLYPSRDARQLYVSNRGSASVTLIDFVTSQIVTTLGDPPQQPDMDGVSPDGTVLWLSGRYDKAVYALPTADGHVVAKVAVGDKPHACACGPKPASSSSATPASCGRGPGTPGRCRVGGADNRAWDNATAWCRRGSGGREVSKELVALGSAVASGLFALLSAVINRRGAARDRMAAADELAQRYRLPLLQAVFDLQTRLYNIGRQDFLGRFAGADASESQREYAINNTLYVIAQYLCFSEIMRHGLLLVNPADRRRRQALTEAMEKVRDAFSTTMTTSDPTLCLFRGEQRAVGEIMLRESPDALPGAPRWDCLGYAEFVCRLDDPDFDRWFRSLRDSLDSLAADAGKSSERLKRLQHCLVELVEMMDPHAEQASAGLRQRL